MFSFLHGAVGIAQSGLYIFLAITSVAVITKVLHAIWTYNSYPSAPGPTLAALSDWWYLFKVWGGKFEVWNIEQHNLRGDVIRVGPKTYSVNSDDAAQIIYGSGSKMPKSEWYTAWGDPNIPNDNLFSALDRQRHGVMRRQVASLYSMSTIKEYEPYVDNCVSVLLEKFREFDGKSRDIQRWMQCYAFDVIGEVTYGTRLGFLDEGEDLDGIMQKLVTSNIFSTLFGIDRKVARLYYTFAGNPTSGLGIFIGKANHKRSQTQAETQVATDFFTKLEAMKEKSPEDFVKNHANRALGANIAAGSDTTSITLTAILFYIYRNPDVLQKLRHEIVNAERKGQIDNPVTFTQCQTLHYLQAVIKEAMRMHSATGLPMWRVVQEPGTTIGSTFFPAGAIVGVNSWVLHRDPKVFAPDSNTFRPERWIESSPEQLKRMEQNYLPFGMGTRTCIGKNISILEMTKLVPGLVMDFDLDMPERMEYTNLWFVRQKPVMATIHRVKQARQV